MIRVWRRDWSIGVLESTSSESRDQRTDPPGWNPFGLFHSTRAEGLP
jgi:hypothetical protein